MKDINRSLAEGFGGELITADHSRYDEARALWNGTVDKRPLVIARPRTVGDVVHVVRTVSGSGLPLAVRGGGHSVAGLSSCEGGVVLDFTLMGDVSVDPARHRASAGPGATWDGYDSATAEHGLASTGGLISSTGVAGLTLGGGIGWLQRKYGLACDNLVAAEVVTAQGEVLRVSESERPDVLWGLRGGGGNLGVVTRLEFELHEVSMVLGGLMLFPLDRGAEVLRAFREWAAVLPDEASVMAAVLTAPPEPFVPEHLLGRKVVGVVGCWCGDLDDGTQVLAPLRALKPDVDLFGPMPYVALQHMLDGAAPAGMRNYFRSGYLTDLGDDVADVLLDHGARMPSPMSAIHVHQMGGALSLRESAFSGRGAAYTYNLVSTWADPREDDLHMSVNRDLAEALAPLARGGTYVNFLSESEDAEERVRTAYGSQTYDRLARLKRELDPMNLFRLNQNVKPAR